uniref:Uncharacterized protein n=1 Tax=Molossus molossus TaxID=27622 RepID=A0A7J8FZA0_MOLMO|nr:hypothetical protein HJG59_008224 [Molossus molossus]
MLGALSRIHACNVVQCLYFYLFIYVFIYLFGMGPSGNQTQNSLVLRPMLQLLNQTGQGRPMSLKSTPLVTLYRHPCHRQWLLSGGGGWNKPIDRLFPDSPLCKTEYCQLPSPTLYRMSRCLDSFWGLG